MLEYAPAEAEKKIIRSEGKHKQEMKRVECIHQSKKDTQLAAD